MVSKILLLFLSLILLGVSAESNNTTCGFSGQCVYNIKIDHCMETRRKRSSDLLSGQFECLCLDLDRAKREVASMTKWASDTTGAIRELARAYNSTMVDLDQKKAQLNDVRQSIKDTNMSVAIAESQNSKLEKQIRAENLNWATEKERLQDELKKITNLVQACQSAQASSTAPTTTTDSSSIIICISFCVRLVKCFCIP